MRGALAAARLVLLPVLLLLPAAASGFAVSLPVGSTVKIDSPSRLVFSVKNAEGNESLSRLTLRFPSGYRVAGGSAPAGWKVESPPGDPGNEVSFSTVDEATCAGAIAPGSSLVFGVDVIAPASRSVTPDSLASAAAEQPCRGVTLSPPPTLPSWDRLGVEVRLIAGPPLVGLGGDITVSMTVTNLSTVELPDIAPLLSSNGTGGVAALTGPTPGSLTLAPGTPGTMSWRARAASAGTLIFSGQAVARDLVSPPAGSDTLVIGDLEVSLSVTPEQVVGGQEVWVEMTVTNRGPVRVASVTPSPLAFEGTARASAPAGPSPAGLPGLEPGESAAFAWVATITGAPGDLYGFSGWAFAESDRIVSARATSNQGLIAETPAGGAPSEDQGSVPLGGGGAVDTAVGAATSSDASGTPTTSAGSSPPASSDASGTPTTSAGSSPPAPGATLEFIGVRHSGSQQAGSSFSGGVLRDLRIIVRWQNLSGSHTQRLELFSPDGALYQTLSAQFAGASVETRLPVGGTWITQHSLFGAWQVGVYLDGERSPVATGGFVLAP